MSDMVSKRCIWTGDTTTHGGILTEGHPSCTYNNTNKAVLVGHRFWCPKCLCWSVFQEGCQRFTVFGSYRVLEGHRASCGATAIHQLGIQDWCDDGPSISSIIRTESIALQALALSNQDSAGGYSHGFYINNPAPDPLGFIVFKKGCVLHAGSSPASDFYRPPVKVLTSDSEKVYLAVRAPGPLLK
ncbi:PAAR domain-containing protein [Serratia proteamaculans]